MAIILILSFVMYYIISKSTPNDRKICDETEEIINGKCVTKCPNNGPRCPSKTGECMAIGDHCIDDKTLCDNDHYCTPKNSSPLCCPSNQHCDKTDPNDQKCVTCPNKTCGGICCPNSTYNCGNGGITCCDPLRIGIDQSGNIKDKCCEEELCDGICCDSANGYVCNTDTDNKKKCMIECPNIKDITSDLYKCNGKSPDQNNVKPTHCKDNEFCVLDCDNQTFICQENNMCWGNLTYDPPLLTYKDADGIEKNYPFTQNKQNNESESVSVNLACNFKPNTQDCDETKGKWLANVSNDLSSNINVDLSKKYSQKNCDIQSCINKIEQEGVTFAKYKTPDSSNTNIINGQCKAKLGNNDLLSLDQATDICSDLDKNYGTANAGRCCKTKDANGNTVYTGQICDIGNTCALIGGDHQCIDINNYCGKNGKWDINTMQCVCNYGFQGDRCCPNGFLGDKCDIVQKWDELYTDNWVIKYVNYLASTTSLIKKDWQTFMVILVNGNDAYLNNSDINPWPNDANWRNGGTTKDLVYDQCIRNNYTDCFYVNSSPKLNFIYQYGSDDNRNIGFDIGGSAVKIHWCNADPYTVCLDTKNSTFLSSVYWKFYPFWFPIPNTTDTLGINILIASQFEYMDKSPNKSPFSGTVIGIPSNDCAKVNGCVP